MCRRQQSRPDIKKGRRLSKKAVGRQKGHEGFNGRLVRAADIKKGLEDCPGLLEGQKGRRGHFKPLFLTRNADAIIISKNSNWGHYHLLPNLDYKELTEYNNTSVEAWLCLCSLVFKKIVAADLHKNKFQDRGCGST